MNSVTKSMISGVVFIALAGGAVALMAWDKKKREADTEAKEKGKLAFELKAEDITRIDVKYAGPRIVAKKDGPDWTILEPVEVPGDSAAWQAMASAVAAINVNDRIPPGELDLAGVGLEAPVTKVVAATKDDKSFEVWVGKKNPFDESYYVRAGPKAGESDVMLVASHHVDSLQKTLLELREQRVFTFGSNEVDSVEVTHRKPSDTAVTFKTVRDGEAGKHTFGDRWKLVQPVDALADSDALSNMVNTFTSARSLGWVDEPSKGMAQYGLDEPATTVKVMAAGKEYVLSLGMVEKNGVSSYWGKRADRPQIAQLNKDWFESVRKDLMSLRDKRIIDFDRDTVGSIKLGGSAGAITLIKKPADAAYVDIWRVTEPKDAPAKSWKVSSLLYTLNSLKMSRFAKEGLAGPTPEDVLTTYGFKQPSRTITMLDPSGKELFTLWVGKQEGSDVYVMRKDGPSVGVMEAKKLEELPSKVEDFLEQPAGDGGEVVQDEGGE